MQAFKLVVWKDREILALVKISFWHATVVCIQLTVSMVAYIHKLLKQFVYISGAFCKRVC